MSLGGIVPTGYTGASAIAMVQLRTNEPSAVTPNQILTFLNAGVEQVTADIGAVRLYAPYPTSAGQITQQLALDIADIYSMSFSTGPVTETATIVYPMYQLEPATFMDTAAGFPGVGAGPPQWWMAYTDSSNQITIQLYPPCMLGQINVYYRARPFQWTNDTLNSQSNLDTMAQEAVILWACCCVLEAVQRGDESKDIFRPLYDQALERIRVNVARRSAPKNGMVRDVRALSYPGIPWWY